MRYRSKTVRSARRDPSGSPMVPFLHHLNRAEVAESRGDHASARRHLRETADSLSVRADQLEDRGNRSLATTYRRLATVARSGSVKRTIDAFHVAERRPRTSRDPSTSPLDRFADDVRRQLDVGDRQVNFTTRSSLGPTDTVFINYYNLPEGVGGAGGGAEAQNNRLLLSVRVGPSKAKVETTVSTLQTPSRDRVTVRGRTGTPEAIAKYVAQSLNKISREVQPRFTHTQRDRARGFRRRR